MFQKIRGHVTRVNAGLAKSSAAAAIVGLAASASSSMAAVDTTELEAFASDAGIAIGTIGMAILLVKYGKKVYVWLNP